jgi:hypothetical protein
MNTSCSTPGPRRHGLRALQRQQGAFRHRDHFAALADLGLDMRDVAGLAGAVDDHEQVAAVGVVAVDEHQVVDDRAFIGQQQAVALLVDAQTDHVDRHQALEGGGRIGADQAQLTHVRDVEQAGRIARVGMFSHQAGRVLHRHRVAGKGHHARAQFEVQGVERSSQQCIVVGHGGLRQFSAA